MSRAALGPVLAAGLAAAPVAGQAQDAPSFLDFLKPDILLQRFAQSGIMALRTQADIQYGDMVVDIVRGQVSISDVQVWPLPEWDENAECLIEADRIVLRSAAVDEPDMLRLKMQVSNVSVHPTCLPPEPRGMLAVGGIEDIFVPRATVDIEYDVPTAGAEVHLYALLDQFAAVDVTADFAYLWMDGRNDMENPDPVMFLHHAALTVENLGAWQALSGMVPPPFTDPGGAGDMVSAMLGNMLAEANRDAADPADTTNADPSALSDEQRAFIVSAGEAWTAFLQDPTKLVLETGFDPADSAYLSVLDYENEPKLVFSDLQPRFGRVTQQARSAVPVALLSSATGEGAATMTEEDRLAVGRALVTGLGAPRNIALGTDILTALAEAGNSAAALTLSEALETRAPEQAYVLALRAGAADEMGAAARLDRLETMLPFERVLALQAEVLGAANFQLGTLESIASVRQAASERLTGVGRSRSYQTAAMWAMIAAAAGDAEARGMLDDIDDIVRMSGAAAREAWVEQERIASNLATQVWIGQDLAARYAAE